MSQQLTSQEIRHLFWRAGFGPSAGKKIAEGERRKIVDKIFSDSASGKEINLFDFKPKKDARMKNMSPEKRKKIRKERRAELRQLNHFWLQKMGTERAQLREKMCFFWHDHFACRIQHPYAMQHLNNLMRRHALGNFRDLLHGVSKHPAMLEYLNNRQNRKENPNENFAREVMELFTLGRGNYSENDIKEAARAFTGWSFNQEGEFVFRRRQHDSGQKTFRGKTGNFEGEQILEMLLEDRRTATYICEKLYAFFVHPQPNETHIQELSTAFYDSGYDIAHVMRTMLNSDWFYARENMGVRIKSPVELMAGMMRDLAMELPEPDPVTRLQAVLGQVLFQPPNVAGWSGGRSWIDSSTLILRMMLPRVFILSDSPEIRVNGDLMDMGIPKKQLRKIKALKADINWKKLESLARNVPDDALPDFIATSLLQTPYAHLDTQLVSPSVFGPDRSSRIKDLYLKILSLPEYQLC